MAGAGPGNEFEEFFFHRLKDGVNCFRPETVFELPALIQSLQPLPSSSAQGSSSSRSSSSSSETQPGPKASHSPSGGDAAGAAAVGDARARAVAAAGAAWAARELTQRAAHCYWAYVIHRVAALERQGHALPPRPSNADGPLGTHEADPWAAQGGAGAPGAGRRKLAPTPGPRAYDCCKCHDSLDVVGSQR
jgi:hypothetical protein